MRLLLTIALWVFTLSPFLHAQQTDRLLDELNDYIKENLDKPIPNEVEIIQIETTDRVSQGQLSAKENDELFSEQLTQKIRKAYLENEFYRNNQVRIIEARRSLQDGGARINGAPTPNPDLVVGCQLSIAIIVDQSGSVSTTERQQIRNGLSAFINNQINTGNTVSFIGMGSIGDPFAAVVGPTVTYNPGVNGNIHLNWINDIPAGSGLFNASSNSDSWSTGLAAAPAADLILVISDGATGNGDMNAACAAANALKSSGANNGNGSHIFVFGQNTTSYNGNSLAGYVGNIVNPPPVAQATAVNMNQISTTDYIGFPSGNFGQLAAWLGVITPGIGNVQLTSITSEGQCEESKVCFNGTYFLCPGVTVTNSVLNFQQNGSTIVSVPLPLNSNGTFSLCYSNTELEALGLSQGTGYDAFAQLNTNVGITLVSPIFVAGNNNDFRFNVGYDAEIISYPECVRQGEPFTVHVRIDATVQFYEILSIYSDDNLYTVTSWWSTTVGPITEVYITVVSNTCNCQGEMFTFDILIDGCSEPIWLMTHEIPCCADECEFLSIEDWSAGDCIYYNGDLARPFTIEVSSTVDLLNVFASTNSATCQTTLADLEITETTPGNYTITGYLIFDDPACVGHALVSLIVETEHGCCAIEQPFSFPRGCSISEPCAIPPPRTQLIYDGNPPKLTISQVCHWELR